MSDKDSTSTADTSGRSRLVRAIAIVAVIAIGYFGWRHFFTPEVGEERDTRKIPWRVTSPNDRPLASDESRGGISTLSVRPIPSAQTDVDRQLAKLDPRRGGWESEALSGAVSAQLRQLAKFLSSTDPLPLDRLAAILADDFSCRTLRPPQLELVHDRRPLRVWRADEETLAAAPTKADFRGARGLIDAFAPLRTGAGAAGRPNISFKVVGIDTSKLTIEARVRVETSVHRKDGARQTVATWICRWSRSADEPTGKPRLQSIHVARYEEAAIRLPGGRLFADCTTAAMGDSDEFRRQYLRGNNYWSERITVMEAMSLLGSYGLALGDVNGDDLDDLYVCDGGGLPNRLFVQNPDGTLSDVSAAAGVDWLEYSTAALLADLDNDGDQDLVVTTVELVLFMENDGTGKFTLRGADRSVDDAYSLSAADFDNDGNLDVYVCAYLAQKQGSRRRGAITTPPIPFNDANNGEANALLKNLGNFRFQNVTKKVGLDQNNTRYSYAAAWEDYDNDGDLDLYVANDYGRNNLYRNDGGKFRDVAAQADVEDTASGMSVSWGDCNRDGRMDLYVGNMFSAAGSRIAYQHGFAPGRSPAQSAQLKRMARGNTLFVSSGEGASGDGRFEDVSLTSGASMGRWAWGSKFADLNNDGWEDLIVANGFLTNSDSDDL
jgi:hypothetical protein